MRLLRVWIAALALGGLPSSTVAAQEQVDLLLYNGKVFTADATQSIHQAVAIRGNRIVAVGGNALAERYSAVRTVDLEGRLVTPGFNDTHIHVRGNPRRYIDFARALDESPRYDHRHYLNHFTVRPPEETLRRMAEYNIHVSQQPNFTYTIEGRYVRNLTDDRAAHNNPVKTVTDHGIFMAFASDILPIDPRVGLYAAVTRKGMSGKAYAPEDEAISMADAITAYTRNAAYLTWEEDIKGTIEPGKLADLVVLSEDLLTIDPEHTMEVEIDLTVIDGKVVYERP